MWEYIFGDSYLCYFGDEHVIVVGFTVATVIVFLLCEFVLLLILLLDVDLCPGEILLLIEIKRLLEFLDAN